MYAYPIFNCVLCCSLITLSSIKYKLNKVFTHVF